MLILEIIIGVFLGFILGLVPNLHINTIGFLFVLVGLLRQYPQNLFFFISVAVSQLVSSFVPSCLFGIPNDQNILTIFPTHKLFLEGKAKLAIFLCMVGCFFGVFFSLLLLPILFLIFNVLGNFSFFIYSAILFVLLMFVYEAKGLKNKLASISIIIISGALGILTLKTTFFLKEPLLVCIFGLFAAPFLLIAIFNNQKKVIQKEETPKPSFSFFTSLLGVFSSMFIILIPSFSSAQAGLVVSKIKNNLSSNEYIVLFSSIAISSLIFSFFLAFTFFKSRLGYIVVLRSFEIITLNVDWVVFCLVVVISVSLSILLVLLFIDDFILFVNCSNHRLINIVVFLISIVVIFSISGKSSLFFLLLSMFIGFLPIIFNRRRVILMSYIMIPTLLYYI